MISDYKLKSLALNFDSFRIRNLLLYPLSYGGSRVGGERLGLDGTIEGPFVKGIRALYQVLILILNISCGGLHVPGY